MARPDRRRFLEGIGTSLALPLLESLAPEGALAADQRPPTLKRLVCIGTYLGFHQPDFFPATTGSDYRCPTLLDPVSSFRDRFTVFSGLDHRGRNGHDGWKAWLSGSASGSVSLDQEVAARIGDRTRFGSLQVTCGSPPDEARMSFTPEGVALPMIGRPSVLYRTLFRSAGDRDRADYLLSTNRSILDGAIAEAKALAREVSASDRSKLDEYLAAVRTVERDLQKQRAWLDRPVPSASYALPEFDPVAPGLALECESIMYDLMALALTTDSTRVVTFLIPGWSQVFTIEGRQLSAGYHGLSHHGNDPARIADYNLVGVEHVKRFAAFLDKLRSATDESGLPLLDSTAVLFGSGMGDANTHDNSNLPTLLAGGRLRHGAHREFRREAVAPRLLGDLYLTILHQFGIEADSFAGASHNLNEHLL